MDASVRDTLAVALEILNLLLAGEDISKTKNKELYEKYVYSSEVEELLGFIAQKNDLQVYRYNEKLFICPGAENKVFGYTNDELKKRLGLRRNDQLFLGYFVMMTLITMFYKESGVDTPINYVKFADLVDEVSKKFEALVKLEDMEKVSRENQFNFADVYKVWVRIGDGREDILRGKNDKVSFIKNICQFLQDEKLVALDQDRNLIYPADRFKAIVYYYFEEKENRNDLFSFINGLEVEHAAY
jgi:hypothetical protein